MTAAGKGPPKRGVGEGPIQRSLWDEAPVDGAREGASEESTHSAGDKPALDKPALDKPDRSIVPVGERSAAAPRRDASAPEESAPEEPEESVLEEPAPVAEPLDPVDSGSPDREAREGSRPAPGAGVVVTVSSRALERALLETIGRLERDGLGNGRDAGAEPWSPIRVVVPSTSLRSHLIGAVARHFGRPVLGLVCQTHHALARDVLARQGRTVATSSGLTALLARRYAATEPALARRLRHLTDGFGAVVGTVSDFLDAGLEPAHVEGLLELLAEEGSTVGSYAEVERAGAALRVAARTHAGHEQIGVLPASGVVQRATEALRESRGSALPSRSILIYGYADATGSTIELLTTLLGACGGALFVERPQDPAEPSAPDRGTRLVDRFLERFTATAGSPVTPPADRAPPPIDTPAATEAGGAISAFRALGTDAESREVAVRCRRLLADGIEPERIGVVARDLAAHAIPLRRHFGRLGVPFSGVGAHGPPEPFARRVEGLLDLLGDRDRLPLDRWFELVAASALGAPRADLKIALAAAGQSRLADLAALDVERLTRGRNALALPVRVGISDDTEDPEPRSRAPRRTLAAAALRNERQRARLALAQLVDAGPLSAWRSAITQLLGREGLALREETKGRIEAALAPAFEGLPDDLTLRHSEVARLVERSLRDAGDRSLGGHGGGVQILDVTESRGRTYEHLFVLGINRGSFPRTIHPDPFVSDPLRQLIASSGHGLLPDLPVKRRGFDEERFLFAQLLGASPEVTLSWLEADAEGRPAAPSPLVERLQWSGRVPGPIPLVGEAAARPRDAPRAPWERAVEVALRDERSTLERVLPILRPDADGALAECWAAARCAVLAEQAPQPGSPAASRLGPYFGFVGPATENDPRRTRPLFVTTLERLARCPWNTFLDKLLALTTYPDPFDLLPRVDGLRLGDLVHRALERIAGTGDLGDNPSPQELATLPGTPIDWSRVDVESVLRDAADQVVLEMGTPAPGFAVALARAGRPFLDVARRLDGTGPTTVIGAEVFGEVEVEAAGGEAIALHFRADRVDRTATGLEWIDFKTGRPLSEAKRAETRRRHLLAAVRAGEALQGVAYAQAAGGADVGSYYFLRPDIPDDDLRRVAVRSTEEDLLGLFGDAVTRLAGAWYAGTFLPRLLDAKTHHTPPACERCEVAEACLQGDSGARMRLRDWFERGPAKDRAEAAHEPRLRQIWFSGVTPDGDSEPGGNR